MGSRRYAMANSRWFRAGADRLLRLQNLLARATVVDVLLVERNETTVQENYAARFRSDDESLRTRQAIKRVVDRR